VTDIEEMLARSQAQDAFKAAVRTFCTGGTAEPIRIEGFAPRVKVKRVLTHLLATEPHLCIERVALRAQSGCSDFVGTLRIDTSNGSHVVQFIWDCRWRAEQEGWVDCFGFPDQMRAAREYDWRCFQHWTKVESAA
jgi:hypothetical protein